MLRIVQSVPSPKAEPFKQWLAQVGNERIEETGDPEQGLVAARERAIRAYMTQGYSRQWAEQRVYGIEIRLRVTHEWQERGGEAFYALLTEMLHRGAFDISTQEHMALKDFTEGNDGRRTGELRDGMTIRELGVIAFAEAMAAAEHEEHDSHGIHALKRDVQVAGATAHEARLAVERITGQPVVSAINAMPQANTLWGQLPAPSTPATENE